MSDVAELQLSPQITSKIFPVAGMLLSAGASVVYGYQGDWRRCVQGARRQWDRYWQPFHVKIHFHSGEVREADLCKTCATFLLVDALRRVRAGERATAGSEGIEQRGWE